MFIKSCVLTTEGKRLEDHEERQAQMEADASERESSPAGVELRYDTSVQKRPLPRAFGWRLVNVARL